MKKIGHYATVGLNFLKPNWETKYIESKVYLVSLKFTEFSNNSLGKLHDLLAS
jgi:hypothetical protein